VEGAWAAARTKGNYLAVRYHRLAARRGGKRAILAVAHTILKMVYHLLRDQVRYQDLGAHYLGQRDGQGILLRAVRRIECLGYKVTIEAA
jgi:transposase